MKIAFLGWGSLIWDACGLRIRGEWKEDGPLIPIEFARISSKDGGRLTLVICPRSKCPDVREVPTLWAYADHTDLKEATENLRDREGTSIDLIGYVSPQGDGKNTNTEECVGAIEAIRGWAWARRERLGLDAVVWTDLPSNCRGQVTPEEVIAYLERLEDKSLHKACEAERYIRFAPEQVKTTIRRRIVCELGWEFVPEEARLDFKPSGIMKQSKTVTGKRFYYHGKISRSLTVYPTDKGGTKRSGGKVPIPAHAVDFIRGEIHKAGVITMGACRDCPPSGSLGDKLRREQGKSPQFLSYVIPLLREEGFCEYFKEGRRHMIRYTGTKHGALKATP